MASISCDKAGRRTVQFVGADSKRRTIRLGKVSQKSAETVRGHVEQLNSARIIPGTVVPDATARWVRDLEGALSVKLAKVGLVQRRKVATLQAFITEYITGRVDVKPATREIWSQGERGLVDFFGGGKPVREITAGGAENYKMALIGEKLASMTIRKRLQFAKTVFRAMVKHRLIDSNPFAEVGIQATMDPDRQRFIGREDTAKLLEAAPDCTWRTIIALSRFGGLRCPSEVLSLQWQAIDWAAGKMRVTSPKTEHHPGKESRMVPIFPELRPILEEAFEAAPEGAVYVCGERYRAAAMGPHGWRNCNMRTQFERIVKRAGLKPWPRLFHNLRATRQTELAERFPSHVVCDWLGNSEDIARKHYLQTTDEHLQRALEPAPSSSPVNRTVQRPCSALQNPVQSVAVLAGKDLYKNEENPGKHGFPGASSYTNADGEELEHAPDFTGNTGYSEKSAAESGAVGGENGPFDPDLAAVVKAWPDLPEAARQTVLSIIREGRAT